MKRKNELGTASRGKEDKQNEKHRRKRKGSG
nr:MAG TPA: hypothetical protein [Caudoviricetes sp.]